MKLYPAILATLGLMPALCCVNPIDASAQTDTVSAVAAEIPPRWTYSRTFNQTSPQDDAWWRQFDDPLLDSLLCVAVSNNYDLSAAVHRVEAARTAIGQARSAYYPSLALQGGWTKARESGMIDPRGGKASTMGYFSLGLSASWEIDVFGRIYSQVKGEKAAVAASEADRRGVMLSLCSNLASAYFQLRMYQAEREVAISHIAGEEKLVSITEARHEAGLASMLDVRQARIVLYSTQSTLPGLEAMISTSINAIAILAGEFPESLRDRLMEEAPMPNCFAASAIGVPADMVRNRPDVVAAEMQLAEAAANLGVAKKDFLPTLSIDGAIGTSAHNLKDLFSHESLTWSVAPTLTWTLFDGMARCYRTAQAKETMMAAVDNYNSTILSAYQDVENAIDTYTGTISSLAFLQKSADESRKALELSLDMYREGLTPFSNVVDAQVSLLQYEDQLVTSRGSALTTLAQLYTAIGGTANPCGE